MSKMEVVIFTYSEEQVAERDYRDSVEIHINGKKVFSVNDGEPEDNNLGRNFSDVYNIWNIVDQVAKFVAKHGDENLTVEWKNFDE